MKQSFVMDIESDINLDQLTNLNSSDIEKLQNAVSSIIRMEDEKKEITAAIKEQYDLLKSQGYNPKLVKQAIKQLQKSSSERELEEQMLETYINALKKVI